MKELTVDTLKVAFRKLLTTTYFDKTDMVMRFRVAAFAKSLSSEEEEKAIFETLIQVAKGENETLLDEWLSKINLTFYPKKVSGIEEQTDGHLITNVPPKSMRVERLLIKADIPIELCILDVAWLMLYGYKVDSQLFEHCFGNRMDLIANESGVRIGNALFKKYQNLYKNWWEQGIKAANNHLKKNEDVTIINFDITNCYHSIDFSFEEFIGYYCTHWPDDHMENDPLTNVLSKVYQKYWELTKASDEEAFCGKNYEKHPLPLSLMSAHVFANWYLSPLDDFINQQYQPFYYGRYVDDCMVVVKTNSIEGTLEESIQTELPGLIEINGVAADFAFAQTEEAGVNSRLASLELQRDKLFVYRFNCLLPQNSLDEFVKGQMERSSEFRFLTDDADDGNINLEFVTLVNSLDAEQEPGRRFNILEENRYKLSVYLAKLANRLAKYGTAYEHYDEVEKVHRFFKDGLLIKHYQLWEKLMTIYVLAGKKDYVAEFIQNVTLQVQLMSIEEGVFLADPKVGLQILVDSLLFHLDHSAAMALSLHHEQDDINTLYLDTFMVRMHYNQLPLQEFAYGFQNQGVRLQMDGVTYNHELFNYRWMPYYVKYYAIVSALSVGEVYNPDVYERAFDAFCKLNHVGNVFDWMAFCRPPQNNDVVTEINVDLAREPVFNELRTVSVVEMDIPEHEVSEVIDHYGLVIPNKVKVFDNILDQITKIYTTDIFVLPELSLPIYELMSYCHYAATHEVAFVSGIEYIVNDNKVYNYIITCLPITLYGQRDAIPVIRLKNHYAPFEAANITVKGFTVPSNSEVWQNLYHWHGHVFTTYYCYELANVVERSFFFSQIDAMYCPVYNKDTYYYNNIVESCVRDMHCYFVLSNVSHFGDSRVTQPTSHVKMNIMKVKGGNTIDNKAVVLSATLDISRLRNFQNLSEEEQGSEDNKKLFKQTPPNYDKKMVDVRTHNRFVYEFEKYEDKFLSNLAEVGMKY